MAMPQIITDHNLDVTEQLGLPPSTDLPTDVTLELAAARFLEWLSNTPDLGIATKRSYRIDFTQFLSAMAPLGTVGLSDLAERHVEMWKSQMNGLGPATIRRKLVAVSRFFDWARMERLITVNPVEFVRKPKKQRRVQKSVSLDHYEQLIAACRTNRDRAMLGCLFWTGCRRQEVVDLDIGSLDLDQGNLLVRGKGQNERLLPIARNLRTLLVEHLRERGSVTPSEPLFANRDGLRLSSKSINNWFRGLCKRAGLQDHGYTPHACRRGIAQLMDAQGFSVLVIQAFMGHEDPKTTAGYVQATAQGLRGQMDVNPIFGDDEVKTSEQSKEIKALQTTVDQMAATLNAFVERFSPGLDDGVYPIGHAPQPGDAVGHER